MLKENRSPLKTLYTVKYHSKMKVNEDDFRTTETEGIPFQQNSP